MRNLVIWVACGWVLLGSAGVARAECAEARQHLLIARRAVQVHDYARAIAEYRRGYEDDGQPLTLVLLARTYAQAGDLSLALDVYRAYLDEAPDGPRASYVAGEIARLSSLALDRQIEIFDDGDVARLPALPVVDDDARP